MAINATRDGGIDLCRHRDDQPGLHAGQRSWASPLQVTENHAAYVPLQHDYAGAPEQLPLSSTLAKLKPVTGKRRHKEGRAKPEI